MLRDFAPPEFIVEGMYDVTEACGFIIHNGWLASGFSTCRGTTQSLYLVRPLPLYTLSPQKIRRAIFESHGSTFSALDCLDTRTTKHHRIPTRISSTVRYHRTYYTVHYYPQSGSTVSSSMFVPIPFYQRKQSLKLYPLDYKLCILYNWAIVVLYFDIYLLPFGPYNNCAAIFSLE